MKVVFTEAALADLDNVLSFVALHYPALAASVEERIRAVVARIATWPESARIVEDRPGVRVVPLVRYPYKVFYRIIDGEIEILHIHHVSRR
jgi:toxin ParE1/3/4